MMTTWQRGRALRHASTTGPEARLAFERFKRIHQQACTTTTTTSLCLPSSEILLVFGCHFNRGDRYITPLKVSKVEEPPVKGSPSAELVVLVILLGQVFGEL
jgi:hypothetical protein